MSKTSRSVSIARDRDKSALRKGQKAFNSRRRRLRAWESGTPIFQQRYIDEARPLEQTSTALQIRMVHCLDRAYDQRIKAERRKITIVIDDLAGDLTGDDENEGKALKAICDKYSPTRLPQRSTG